MKNLKKTLGSILLFFLFYNLYSQSDNSIMSYSLKEKVESYTRFMKDLKPSETDELEERYEKLFPNPEIRFYPFFSTNKKNITYKDIEYAYRALVRYPRFSKYEIQFDRQIKYSNIFSFEEKKGILDALSPPSSFLKNNKKKVKNDYKNGIAFKLDQSFEGIENNGENIKRGDNLLVVLAFKNKPKKLTFMGIIQYDRVARSDE